MDEDYYDSWYWGDEGDVITEDPWQEPTADDWGPLFVDNGDGSWTDTESGELWNDNGMIGWDNDNGTWWGVDGQLYSDAGDVIEDPLNFGGFDPDQLDAAVSITYDENSGLYYDSMLDIWTDEQGRQALDPYTASGGTAELDGPGFLDKAWDFLKGIFNGPVGKAAANAASARASEAMQKSEQAKQNGSSQQQQQELAAKAAIAAAAAQKAQAAAGGIDTKTLLIAGGLGLAAVYMMTNQRQANPGRRSRRRNPSLRRSPSRRRSRR